MKNLCSILVILFVACGCEPQTHESPFTTIKVFYLNGDIEAITINAYADNIWLSSSYNPGSVRYLPDHNQVLQKTAAAGVRRFEIVSTTYRQVK